jgi:hypothetical protein
MDAAERSSEHTSAGLAFKLSLRVSSLLPDVAGARLDLPPENG